MKKRILCTALVGLVLAGFSNLAFSAAISEFDSTQPRGATERLRNDRGQDLSPVVDGFRGAQYRADGQIEDYVEWAGMTMANAARDPGFFATVSVANSDFANVLNAAAVNSTDLSLQEALIKLMGLKTLDEVLQFLKLDTDIFLNNGSLQPYDLLPVTGDMCLRCHSPVGWMEAHSEPPTFYFDFLKGQFWGGAFLEYPGHYAPITVTGDYPDVSFEPWMGAYMAGTPRLVDTSVESEAEMEGVQCDFCHRATDNYKRLSLYDGWAAGGNSGPFKRHSRWMANGNGGFFVDRYDPFGDEVEPAYEFQEEGAFCGTCHDVTNPLIKTQTEVDGSVPDMLHPIERSYTEWYWSGYSKEGTTCQGCHEPMEFPGAQTWMISPGLDDLWGKVDQKWREAPYGYEVPDRKTLNQQAMQRNQTFMEEQAADLDITNISRSGNQVAVEVEVTNKAGHKLPTGYAEGRQMWIGIKATDEEGRVVFEDGMLDPSGELVRTEQTRVYEHVALAKGYEPFILDGFNVLDADKNGSVSHYEEEFHFVLMNYVEKDNRIPPKGFNKAAYTADGAFIVPYHTDGIDKIPGAKDTDYVDGQNWDKTCYTFVVPAGAKSPITVEVDLMYQTFNREYVDFLDTMDQEKTVQFGGRARTISDMGIYGNCETWGDVLSQIWNSADKGRPVQMAHASKTIN